MTSYILLSAGIGRGMMTKGSKSLLTYDGTEVLNHQILTIRKFDAKADIYVVIGFYAEKVTKYVLSNNLNVRLIYNPNYKITSQTESLRLAINAIVAGPYYIIHGDIIFNMEALKVKKNKSSVISAKYDQNIKAVGICHSGGKLLNLSYGIGDCWGQIAYISKDNFALSKNILNSLKSNKQTYEYLNLLLSKVDFLVHQNDKIKTIEITRDYENTHY
jgi:choline kinase